MRSLFILMTSLLLAVSSSASETTKGMKKDYETFKKEMSVKLDTTEKQIEQLKKDAKIKGNQTQEKLAQELEETKNTLRKQQEDLKYESESGWKKLKKSLSDAAEKLNQKVQEALKD